MPTEEDKLPRFFRYFFGPDSAAICITVAAMVTLFVIGKELGHFVDVPYEALAKAVACGYVISVLFGIWSERRRGSG